MRISVALVIILLLAVILNYFLPLRGVYEEMKVFSRDTRDLPAPTYAPGDKTPRLERPCKIALCLSGQFRFLNEVMQNHTHLLDLRPDVFIYAEDDLDKKEKMQVIDFYRPVSVVWDHDEVQARESLSVNNVKMFKRIWKCDQLRQAHEASTGVRYDVVVRMRPDVVFFAAFPTAMLSKPLLPHRIYFPMRAKNEPILYGLPDLFFWGDSNAMKVMCECFLYLDEMEELHSCLNEYIFMNYMWRHDLIARKIAFPLNLYDRSFYMGRQFLKKYVKGKFDYLYHGGTCYQNNHYDRLVIEDEEDDEEDDEEKKKIEEDRRR